MWFRQWRPIVGARVVRKDDMRADHQGVIVALYGVTTSVGMLPHRATVRWLNGWRSSEYVEDLTEPAIGDDNGSIDDAD